MMEQENLNWMIDRLDRYWDTFKLYVEGSRKEHEFKIWKDVRTELLEWDRSLEESATPYVQIILKKKLKGFFSPEGGYSP